MRTIMAVTVGRSDWGIFTPVLEAIDRDPELGLRLVASGAHLTAVSGHTVDEIPESGFSVDFAVDMTLAGDSPAAVAKSMALGTIGFSDIYQREQPDLLLLLGDRYEMHAAAVAAVPFAIPIAHIHGGEVSYGAIDDCFRHAITKYSHLHFTSTASHAERIVQLGEEPWRVTVSGAPGLDHLRTMELIESKELGQRIGLPLDVPPVLVTYHPVTLQPQELSHHAAQLVDALKQIDRPIVITRPNADSGHCLLTRELAAFCDSHAAATLVDNLGTQLYFSLMNRAAAMVGNSSSGIIEAASFGLPVVNIGLRQAGRARSGNTLDVQCQTTQIVEATRRACSSAFRDQVRSLKNVYGDGNAAERIVERLRSVELDEKLMLKRFYDLPGVATGLVAA